MNLECNVIGVKGIRVWLLGGFFACFFSFCCSVDQSW